MSDSVRVTRPDLPEPDLLKADLPKTDLPTTGRPKSDLLAPDLLAPDLLAPDLLAIAWNRKLRHAIVGALVAILLVGLGATLPARYKATTQLLVDPRDIKVLDNQLTPQAEAQNIGVTLVESQVLVLQSESILHQVVDRLKLDQDDEFNGRRASPIRSILNRLLDSTGVRRTGPSQEERLAALFNLQRFIRVRRLDRTYVIEASSSAESRDKARQILEALVAAYLDDQAVSRSDIARRTGQDLDSGVTSLRKTLEGAERKLSTYMQQNNLIVARGQLVNEQQLADLNGQLVNARVDVSRLEARRGVATGSFDNLPEALASPTLRDLRANLARVSQQKAALEAHMLPGHPAVRTIADNERKIFTMINAEVGRIREASEIELRRARANERALEKKLGELRELSNMTNNAQVQLRELEREVEVNRNLYRAAVTRTREAQEQSRVNTANVRVISAPTTERDRIFPPPVSFLAVFGFGLGALLSMIAAFTSVYFSRRTV